MSLCKMDKSLKELHKKLEEERMLRELPGLVAGIEDAMCEQDMQSAPLIPYPAHTWHQRSGLRLSRTRCASWTPPSTNKEVAYG